MDTEARCACIRSSIADCWSRLHNTCMSCFRKNNLLICAS